MNEVAEIREQLIRAKARQNQIIAENKILGYLPNCRAHNPRPCPDGCDSKYLAFHRSRAKNRWVFGGNSSGKTFMGFAELTIRATFDKHPFTGEKLPHPAFHRIGFESYRNLETYYLPLLKEWIPKSMLVGGTWSDSYNVKYNVLKLVNGDQIDMLSYDVDDDKWASSTLHTCWADEKIPEEIYSEVMGRLLRTNGHFWCTVTPIGGMPWLLTRIWGLNNNDTQTWNMDMDDNPHITEEGKKRIMAEWSPEQREARKTGKPTQFQGIVYPEIDEHAHLTDRRPEPHWPLYFCMDAHPRKECQMVWIAIDPAGAGYVVDELSMKGTPKELADGILRKEYDIRRWIGAPFKGVQRRLIDLSALTLDSDIQDHYDLLAEFRKCGLAFTQANRSSVGYSVVHQYLSYDKSKPLNEFNRPMLYFCRNRVPKTYFSMTHLMYDEYKHSGDRDKKERVKDWGKDPADCVRYILIERPKFQFLTQPTFYAQQPASAGYYMN